MIILSWIRFSELDKARTSHKRAYDNYFKNRQIGIKTQTDEDAPDCNCLKSKSPLANKYSSVTKIWNKDILRAQYSGHFPLMKFSKAKMSETCCEVMGTYNALKLYGAFESDKDFDVFFKLAAEFEVNALFLLKTGHFGSNPFKIGRCLNAYKVAYDEYRSVTELDSRLNNGDIAIIGYRHHLVCMHVFCCVKENGKVISINRGSGCLYNWKNDSVSQCLKKGKFLVGYILKNDKE